MDDDVEHLNMIRRFKKILFHHSITQIRSRKTKFKKEKKMLEIYWMVFNIFSQSNLHFISATIPFYDYDNFTYSSGLGWKMEIYSIQMQCRRYWNLEKETMRKFRFTGKVISFPFWI